jgi:hypothetical protein
MWLGCVPLPLDILVIEAITRNISYKIGYLLVCYSGQRPRQGRQRRQVPVLLLLWPGRSPPSKPLVGRRGKEQQTTHDTCLSHRLEISNASSTMRCVAPRVGCSAISRAALKSDSGIYVVYHDSASAPTAVSAACISASDRRRPANPIGEERA